jgi:transposase
LGQFKREGLEGLQKDGRKGGNKQKVSTVQELVFLTSYVEDAKAGKIITTKDLWLDYQEEFNVTMTRNAFYKLLDRHNWRKIIPRQEHPKKASDAEIEASKKLTLSIKNR